jgi:hypothetical protein
MAAMRSCSRTPRRTCGSFFEERRGGGGKEWERERERGSEFFVFFFIFRRRRLRFSRLLLSCSFSPLSPKKKEPLDKTTHRMHPPQRDPRGPDAGRIDVEQLRPPPPPPLAVAAAAVPLLAPLDLLVRTDEEQPVQNALQVPAVVD